MWTWTIERPIATWMLTLTIVVFGWLSLDQMPVSLMPELSYPTITVRYEYPGAAPAEVEHDIVNPSEDLLRMLEGVREVESVARIGGADILIRYNWGTDLNEASQRIRERLVLVTLPTNVDSPDILRYDPTLEPMVRLSLQSEQQLSEVRTFAEQQFSAFLEGVEGVASAGVSGRGERQVSVEVDADRAEVYGVDIQQVSDALERANIAVAGGRVQDAGREYIVRTLHEFDSIEDIRDVAVITGENPVYLQDIADISLEEGTPESLTRINGETSIEVEVFRESDANLVATAERVRERLKGWKEDSTLQGSIPAGLKMTVMNDQSRYIRAAIDEVRNTAFIGAICAVLMLFLFIRRLWPTLIIATAIPLSVIASFAPLNWLGVTLNIMSLGGLALGIGMLVDNAVVVLESIVRHQEEGKSPREAAAVGTREVGGAVTASTLTTIAVFVPVFFLEGQAGQLFGDLAWAVILSLLASLAFALFFVPMLTALPSMLSGREVEQGEGGFRGEKAGGGAHGGGRWQLQTWARSRNDIQALSSYWVEREGIWRAVMLVPVGVGMLWVAVRTVVLLPFEVIFGLIFPWIFRAVVQSFAGEASFQSVGDTGRGRWTQAYVSVLQRCIRWGFVVLGIVVLLAVGAWFVAGSLGVEVLPTLRQGQLYIDATLPAGRSLEETDRWAARVASELGHIEGVRRISSRAGATSSTNEIEYAGANEVTLRLELATSEQPVALENRVMKKVKELLEDEPALTWELRRPSLFSLPASAEVRVVGDDLSKLAMTSQKLAEEIRGLSSVESVHNYQQGGFPEVRVLPKRARLSALGVTARDIGQRVRARVLGEVVTQIRLDSAPIDVHVSMGHKGGVNNESVSMEALESMRIPLDTVTLEEDFAQGGAGAMLQGVREDLVQLGGESSERQAQSSTVPLRFLADVTRGVGPSEIRHLQGQRVARIDIFAGISELGQLRAGVEQMVASVDIPEEQSVVVGGQAKRFEETRSGMLAAFAIAIFLVYVVLASRFEAFVPPLVILTVVPLSVIGIIGALWLTGIPVSALVLIGVIVTAGIVVNNAIVLVDYALQLFRRGRSMRAATVEASAARLRPIWITTLTTVLGLVPLLVSGGEGAEIRRPLGLVLASGLLSSTALTLVVIPIIQSTVTGRFVDHNEEQNADGESEAIRGEGL